MENIYKEIITFSLELKKTIITKFHNFNISSYPLHYGILFITKNYVIYRDSHPWDNWKYILETIPKKNYSGECIIGGNAPWLWTLNNNPLPENWYYKFKGTGTENLPSKKYQNIILNELYYNFYGVEKERKNIPFTRFEIMDI